MKKQGFVLIELLVAITIIGILSTLLLANFNAARDRARDVKRKSDLKNIQTALRVFYNDFKMFPDYAGTTGSDAYKIKGCGTNTSFVKCDWKAQWLNGSTVYMSILADDPKSDRDYRYTYDAVNDDYTLKACLENKSDGDCSTAAETWCTDTTTLNGCVYSVQP